MTYDENPIFPSARPRSFENGPQWGPKEAEALNKKRVIYSKLC